VFPKSLSVISLHFQVGLKSLMMTHEHEQEQCIHWPIGGAKASLIKLKKKNMDGGALLSASLYYVEMFYTILLHLVINKMTHNT